MEPKGRYKASALPPWLRPATASRLRPNLRVGESLLHTQRLHLLLDIKVLVPRVLRHGTSQGESAPRGGRG
jgi:hypothetical protein